MRLLNVKTFRLQEFLISNTPRYAILSHTWGTEEVLYQDVTKDVPEERDESNTDARSTQQSWSYKEGARKLRDSAALAAREGYEYIWIDACCIDKSSSAELSEAINSMFEWYARADICFVYLVDFTLPAPVTYHPEDQLLMSLHESRWFRRGWTLQELIAPEEVHFYDKDWAFIGTRDELSERLHRITSIAMEVLDGRIARASSRVPGVTSASACLGSYSVSEKMQWAADRETTREEDLAYCLLGIFDINMPLLYGEGSKAFARLQRKILKQTNDQSIFVFDRRKADNVGSFFASSASDFKTDLKVKSFRGAGRHVAVHQNEIIIDLILCPLPYQPRNRLGILHCYVEEEYAGMTRPAVVLTENNGKFSFDPTHNPYLVRHSDKSHAVRFPGFSVFEYQRKVNLDETHQEIVSVHHSPQLLLHDNDSAWDIPLLLNPIQGASAQYLFGLTYPARTGTEIMVKPAQLTVDGYTVLYAVCVDCHQYPPDPYPLIIICAKRYYSHQLVIWLLPDPPLDPDRQREDPLSDQEVRKLLEMRLGLPWVASRLETSHAGYRGSIVLTNKDKADVQIRKCDFLGISFYELNIVITSAWLRWSFNGEGL
ncbi:heterokaryon incompatibility protein-domain-containing protein [Xylaria grammica]|nr:heterokaryon incompatibility protein-domain-containing protein [Xylaria grammica]